VVLKGTTYGTCDLVALRHWPHDDLRDRLSEAWLIEVKSTAGGPYHSFGPADRASLIEAATQAGATAVLAWWPPRGQLRLIESKDWPTAATPPASSGS
jgi:hypothetical protein